MKPPETPIARQSRPIQRRAVHVERRPVHGLVAHAAGPGGVPAAMAEAGDVTDQDVVRPEGVAVGASRGWVGDPSPGRGLHEVADHPIKPRPRGNHPRSGFSVGGGPS